MTQLLGRNNNDLLRRSLLGHNSTDLEKVGALSSHDESPFQPQPGDQYCLGCCPASGQDLRCAVVAVNADSMVCDVQFYDKETNVLRDDTTVTVPLNSVRPLMYPAALMQPPVFKSSLMDTERRTGLSTSEALRRKAQLGPNMLEESVRNIWLELLRHFWGPMPAMIWAAIAIELYMALNESSHWSDFVVLLVLQSVNSLLGWYEDMKAGNAVDALKASLKPFATVKRDGSVEKILLGELVPGDIVLLGAGAAVPADCELLGGPLQIDQAALTGESLPVTMQRGQVAKMGSTVTGGECEAIVSEHGPHTFFGKTASMIASVEQTGHFETIMLRITFFMMLVSFILVGVALAVLLLRGEDPIEAIAFCVILLVASIPIAMPLVSLVTMSLGSRTLSAQGAIITRLAAIEEVAGMDMLCSDKTGTLTKNIMELQEETPVFVPGWTREDVRIHAALAAMWKEPPKDALDTLVLQSFGTKPQLIEQLAAFTMLEHVPFNPTDKRTESTIQDSDGRVFKVSKGAPHVILAMAHNVAEISAEVEAVIDEFAQRGIRCLSVARTSPCTNLEEMQAQELAGTEAWEYLGVITFLDPPREDTAHTIAECRELGVQVKMITGDQQLIAQEMARTIGLGTDILLSDAVPDLPPDKKAPKDTGAKFGPLIEQTDGFAQVFPEHKFMIVEALKQRGWACGMTGDGVNDAPALKVANIGIAVQGATDAAQAAADIVLTRPGLNTIALAIRTAREIFRRLRNYVIYRISCTIQLLLFFFIGVVLIEVPAFRGMSPASATGALGCALAPPETDACFTPCDHSHGINSDQVVIPAYRGVPMPELCNVTLPVNNHLSWYVSNSADAMRCRSLPFDSSSLDPDEYGDDMVGCHSQFLLPVMALVLITVLNDGTIISIAYDRVVASKQPELWRLSEVFLVSTLLGSIAVASSITLLYLGLDANAVDDITGTPNSVFYSLGLLRTEGGTTFAMSFAKVQTMMYLKISLSDFLTVFSARTRGPFFSRRPGNLLLGAACFAMGVSTLLAAFWPFAELQPLSWLEIGVIWGWCVGWFLVQDGLKCALYYLISCLTPGVVEMLRLCKEDKDRLAKPSRTNRESLLRDSARPAKVAAMALRVRGDQERGLE